MVLLLALFAINISKKSGLPSLLIFLLLGISFNVLGVKFDDFYLTEKFATVALLIIIFYGGFGTNWKVVQMTLWPIP